VPIDPDGKQALVYFQACQCGCFFGVGATCCATAWLHRDGDVRALGTIVVRRGDHIHAVGRGVFLRGPCDLAGLGIESEALGEGRGDGVGRGTSFVDGAVGIADGLADDKGELGGGVGQQLGGGQHHLDLHMGRSSGQDSARHRQGSRGEQYGVRHGHPD
jgi:hypothetical protein